MICEICGKRPSSSKIIIEGAEVEICSYCMKGISKDINDRSKPMTVEKRIERTKITRVVRDAKQLIETYMRNKSLDLRALSSISGVSERDIKAIMERKLIDLNIIRKLERVIGKNLIEEEIVTELVEPNERKAEARATLEDFVEIDGK